jgi:hypothetical protein
VNKPVSDGSKIPVEKSVLITGIPPAVLYPFTEKKVLARQPKPFKYNAVSLKK